MIFSINIFNSYRASAWEVVYSFMLMKNVVSKLFSKGSILLRNLKLCSAEHVNNWISAVVMRLKLHAR